MACRGTGRVSGDGDGDGPEMRWVDKGLSMWAVMRALGVF